jgi:hypothetical protein
MRLICSDGSLNARSPAPALVARATPLTYLSPAALASGLHRAYWRLSDRLRTDTDGPYHGGLDMDGAAIFQRELRENPDSFAVRKQTAAPIPFVRQIADHYTNHVFRAGRRVTPAANGAAAGSTPLPGLEATQVGDAMRTAGRLAFVEQAAFVLVDPTGPRQAVLRVVQADRVWWCHLAPDGRVLSAIVRLDDAADGTPALWRFDAQTRQRADLGPTDQLTQVHAPQPHGFAGCPLLLLAGLPAIIPDVADLQRSICIQRTWLLQGRRNGMTPLIVGTGIANSDEFVNLIKKNSGVVGFNSESAAVDAIALDSGSPDGIAQDIRDTTEDLYRVAKVQPIASGSAPESGIARAYRFVDADVDLAAYAATCRRTEQRAWDLIAAALQAPAPTVSYGTSFVPRDLLTDLTNADTINRSSLPKAVKQAVLHEVIAQHFPQLDPGVVDAG